MGDIRETGKIDDENIYPVLAIVKFAYALINADVGLVCIRNELSLVEKGLVVDRVSTTPFRPRL